MTRNDDQKNRAARKCFSATGAFAIGALVQCFPAQAEGAALPIKSISVDPNHQLVVQFQGGGFPTVPTVLDRPGPNHRVVFDFANATIDRGNMPSSQAITSSVSAQLPGITNVRFSEVANAEKPTARVVLHVPEKVGVNARVVKVEEGQVVINLGNDLVNAPLQALDASAVVEKPVLVAQAQPQDDPDAVPSATVPGAPQGKVAPAPQGTGLGAAKVISSDLTNKEPASYEQAYEQMLKQKELDAINEANAKWDKAVGPSTPVIPPQNAAAADKAGGWDWTSGGTPPGEFTGANTIPAQALTKTIPVQPETQATIDAVLSGKAVPLTPSALVPQARTQTAQVQAAPAQAAPAQAEATQAPAASASDTPLKPAIAEETPGTTAAPTPAEAPAETKAAPSPKEAVKLFNQAVNFHLTGKLNEAIEAYKGAIASNPDLAQAHSNLGLIYNQQHNYAGALTEFRKALAINPKDAITYNGIGAALRAERDLMGAVKNWQTAVSLDPSLATAHYNLGTAYEIQKELDKALDSYQQAVKNDYRLGEAYYRMGLIMTRKNRPEEAAEKFTQALKISAKSEYSEDARQRLASLTQKKAVK